jgi:hypothetical protein
MSEYCLKQAIKSGGEEFDEAAFTELADRIDNMRKEGKSSEEVAAFTRDLLDSTRKEAGKTKTTRLYNMTKQLEMEDFAWTQFRDSPRFGIESLLVGTNTARIGNKVSAEAHQNVLMDKYLGRLFADLEAGGYEPILSSGKFDLAIRQEWWNLDVDPSKSVTGIKEAQEIAKIFRKHFDESTLDANQNGAWIEKLESRTTRHSYDSIKIERAGRAKFIESAMNLLDHDKTFKGVSDKGKPEFLKNVYETLTVGKLQESPHLLPDGSKKFFPKLARSGVARKWGAQRVLHFKSAEAEHDFMQQFGRGNLREEVFGELMGKARTTGLSKSLGTVPKETIEAVVKSISKRLRATGDDGDLAQAKKLEKAWDNGDGYLGNILKELDGRANHPVNEQFARYAANYRAVKRMAVLGLATISSIGDIATASSELRFQGKGMLSAYADVLSGIGKGRGAPELRALHADLGAFSSSMLGEINRRFSMDDTVSGKLGRMEQKFFKYIGLNWWTDALRTAVVDSMSTRLASMRSMVWADVDKDLKRVLQNYSIDEGKWDIIRVAKTVDHDGLSYASPGAIKNLPDSHFENYLQKNDAIYQNVIQRLDLKNLQRVKTNAEKRLEGLSATKKDVEKDLMNVGINLKKAKNPVKEAELKARKDELTKELEKQIEFENTAKNAVEKEIRTARLSKQTMLENFRQEVEDNMRLYFIDRAHTGVIETGARTRATLRQGIKAGTGLGELARMVTLFKGYPTSFIQKTLGREVYGYDANYGQLDRSAFTMAAKAMVNVSGRQAGGILSLVLATTALGYIAGATKDLLKGKEPRDPLDIRTVLASLAQGGGLGIYGDFLFGQVLKENRFGSDAFTSMAGPFASDFSAATKIASAAANGGDAAAMSVKFGLGFVPFANFPVVRSAADYAFLYGIQESLNPGYLRRMERNMEEQTGQRYIIPPSSGAIR